MLAIDPTRNSTAFLWLAFVCLVSFCGGEGDDNGDTTTIERDSGLSRSELIGAWSGTTDQIEGKEKEYCIVVCENGRYFSDDNTRQCTAKPGDTSAYFLHSIHGNRIYISDAEGEVGSVDVEITNDGALFSHTYEGTTYVIPMQKVADSHEACSGENNTLRTRD